MAVVFKLPDLGENIESAEVVSVAAAVGDMIEADQTIIEVETDKAVTDVPAPIGGKLLEIAVTRRRQGGGRRYYRHDRRGRRRAPVRQPRRPTKQPRCRPQRRRRAKPTAAEAPAADRRAAPAPRHRRKSRCRPTSSDRPVQASPSVRKFAREIGVDIAQVTGSGPAGRISIDDVKSHSRRMPAGGGRGAGAQGAARFRQMGRDRAQADVQRAQEDGPADGDRLDRAARDAARQGRCHRLWNSFASSTRRRWKRPVAS